MPEFYFYVVSPNKIKQPIAIYRAMIRHCGTFKLFLISTDIHVAYTLKIASLVNIEIIPINGNNFNIQMSTKK